MELLDKLEQLAGLATPGPWKHKKSIHGNKYRYVQFDREEMYTTSELEAADARYIAACHPQAILALVRVGKAAEAIYAAIGDDDDCGDVEGRPLLCELREALTALENIGK